MDVFHIGLELEITRLDLRGDALQRGGQHRTFVLAQQADMREHPDVRERTLHIVTGEPAVEDPIVPDRETLHCFRCGSAFIPESSHIESQ